MTPPFLPRAISCRKILMAASLMVASLAWGQPPVAPFSLEYRLKSQGIPFAITATRTLQEIEGGLWQMDVHASNWLGEIRETALFSWDACTPQSRSYEYLRKGLGRVKEAKLHLDRRAGVAASERTDKAMRSYPISDNATDELSASLALQCALQQGEKDITLSVADEREQQEQRFKVIGTDSIKVDGERIATVKVQRVRGANSTRQTYLWFAPSRDYLLVQLQQKNNDGEHLMTLKSLRRQ